MEETFGSVLRERRRAVGLSQRELAQRIGLDFSYISKLENGRLPAAAADTVVAICAVLGIRAEELLALTGKLPSAVEQSVGTSLAAQRFLSEAERMGLTDAEWGQLADSLRRLRRRER